MLKKLRKLFAFICVGTVAITLASCGKTSSDDWKTKGGKVSNEEILKYAMENDTTCRNSDDYHASDCIKNVQWYALDITIDYKDVDLNSLIGMTYIELPGGDNMYIKEEFTPGKGVKVDAFTAKVSTIAKPINETEREQMNGDYGIEIVLIHGFSGDSSDAPRWNTTGFVINSITFLNSPTDKLVLDDMMNEVIGLK